MKKYIFLICIIIALFLFLRLYNLENSLFFFNDIGRDFNVLFDWQHTGKLPLLGPQTSALPINQSAIYFYLLFPIYLITGGYFLASTYTAIAIYIIVLFFGLKYCQKYTLPLFYLVAIHPQIIAQTRSVWNPTFTLPFVLISIYAFYLLLQKYSLKRLLIFSSSIALAISFSYSIVPLLICYAIYWLIFSRKHFFSIALSLFGSIVLFNLPTLLFEVRHQFLLITSLFTKTAPVQERLLPIDKLNALSTYIFSTNNNYLNIGLFLIFIILCLYIIFKNPKSSFLFQVSFLYLTLNILIFILPFTIQAHYIFAFIGLIFFIVVSLPSKIKYILILFFSIIYLNKPQLNKQFVTAPRTYYQIDSCIKNYCQSNSQLRYVTVNSSYHPWHYGPEFRYLFKKNDCSVLNIETQNGQSNLMSVVLDNSTLSPQTSYYELELFGKWKEIDRLKCQDNFEIVSLER